jgi:voltage-gated potassium channel
MLPVVRKLIARLTPLLSGIGVLAMFFATLPELPRLDQDWFDGVLFALLAIFTVDWVLYLHEHIVTHRKWTDLRSFEHITHVLAVLPITAALALGFRQTEVWLFSALWLLKLPVAISGFTLLFRVVSIEAKPLASVAIMFAVILMLSAVAMHLVEGGVQPAGYGTLYRSVYWAVTTLTTTGYGDVVPVTAVGRSIAGFVMICGLTVFGLLTGILATGFAAESRRREFARTWDLVAKVPFFRNLQPTAIIGIAQMLRRWDVPERTIVVRKGRQGDCMYFIASGQVEVLLDDGSPVHLNQGSFFGEMALLGSGVRNATVATTVPSTLLILDATDFHLLAANHPDLATTVRAEAERRRHGTLTAGAEPPAVETGRS